MSPEQVPTRPLGPAPAQEATVPPVPIPAGRLEQVPPVPVPALGAAMVATGLGLGIALTCSVSLTMEIAPPRARGTALSIRMTAIRMAQFVLPLAAGLVVAPLGAAGTFACSGIAILCAAGLRPRYLSLNGRDRKLCVPASRRVCQNSLSSYSYDNCADHRRIIFTKCEQVSTL